MPIRKNASMEKYIKDFEKSDAPQFKGKSKDKRIQMAVAAKLQSMGKKMEEGSNMEEAIDVNDPALVKARAAAHQRTLPKPEIPKPVKTINPAWKAAKNADKIRALKKQRAQLMIDMEQEAEPEGGPIANRYGRELNKIDKAIAMLSEAKATYCGRCGHTHVKGTPCPRPFKEGVKPDFLDLDNDKNTSEPMKKAAKDAKLKHEVIANVMGKIKEAVVTDDAKEAERITKSGTEVKLVPKGSIKEGMERDYEGKMAKAQLISIVKNAKDLFDSMDDNTQLKAWIQSKLSKAEDYISSVRTYLDGESLTTTTPLVHNGEPVRDDEGSALNIGDVVKAADGKIYQVVFSYSEGKPFLTPFDLKRRKPMNLRERHYFDNVSEEMNKTLKMSKVMEYTATKGGFMR